MPNRDAQFTYTPEEAEYPGDTINVWDYEKDVPTIERTLDAFQAECDEWLKNQD